LLTIQRQVLCVLQGGTLVLQVFALQQWRRGHLEPPRTKRENLCETGRDRTAAQVGKRLAKGSLSRRYLPIPTDPERDTSS
jgi:hypothetical protein